MRKNGGNDRELINCYVAWDRWNRFHQVKVGESSRDRNIVPVNRVAILNSVVLQEFWREWWEVFYTLLHSKNDQSDVIDSSVNKTSEERGKRYRFRVSFDNVLGFLTRWKDYVAMISKEQT